MKIIREIGEYIKLVEQHQPRQVELDTETRFDPEVHAQEGTVTRYIKKSENNVPFMLTAAFVSEDEIYVLSAHEDMHDNYRTDIVWLIDTFKKMNTEIWISNAKFDMHILANIGCNMLSVKVKDLFILAYFVFPEHLESFTYRGLNGQIKAHLSGTVNNHKTTMKDLIEATKKKLGYKKISEVSYYDVYGAYRNDMESYAINDVIVQIQLKNVYIERIRELGGNAVGSEWSTRKRSYDLNQKVLPYVWRIERTGIRVDKDKIAEERQRLNQVINYVGKKISDFLPEGVKITQRAKIGEFIDQKYSDLAYDWISTKTGKHNFNKDVKNALLLEEDKPELLEFIKMAKYYDKATKYLSTYIENLDTYIQNNNKIHASFNIMGTATGRFSSSAPNMQNMPKGDAELPLNDDTMYNCDIRGLFRANKQFVKLDYDQQEYRYLAMLSEDPKLLQFIGEGKDIHSATASLMFEKDYEYIEAQETDEAVSLRKKGKTNNFGVVYGLGNISFMEALGSKVNFKKFRTGAKAMVKCMPKEVYELPPYVEVTEELLYEIKSLAPKDKLSAIAYYLRSENLHMLKEAAETKKKYFEQFPKIKEYDKTIQKYVRKNNIAHTWLGNPRDLRKDPRKALNTIIQGSCAEMQKVKIIEIYEYLDNNNYTNIEVVNLVHDEIIFDTDELETMYKIKEIMEDFPYFNVHFSAGFEVGEYWSKSDDYDSIDSLREAINNGEYSDE